MTQTTLAFYRAFQELDDLETTRPQSLATVRRAVSELLDDIINRVGELEAEFYGLPAGPPEEDAGTAALVRVERVLRSVMAAFSVTYVHAAYQVGEMESWAAANQRPYDPQALAEVVQYHNKLLEFMPSRFEHLIADLRRVLSYLHKYLVSFWDGGGNPSRALVERREMAAHMEAACHYDMKRREMDKAVNMHINNIRTMAGAYRSPSGLTVKMFGVHTNAVARRLRLGDLPILLVFPEACQNIRQAAAACRRWIDADQQYPEFLKLDIENLERKRGAQLKLVKEAKGRLFHEEHEVKEAERDITELEGNIDRLRGKDRQISGQIEQLTTDLRLTRLDVQTLERERDDLKRVAVAPEERARVAGVANTIIETRNRIPEIQKKMQGLEQKLTMVTELKSSLASKQVALTAHVEAAAVLRREVDSSEAALKTMETCLTRLKDIYARKTSNDVTAKIFHGLPVEPRNKRQRGGRGKQGVGAGARKVDKAVAAEAVPAEAETVAAKNAKTDDTRDPLGVAVSVVARLVGSDWPALYRRLPFYPPRGRLLVDDDIVRTVNMHARNTHTVRARVSLERWRRLHARACVRDLVEALRRIRRLDVVARLDERRGVRPPPPPLPRGIQAWRKIRHFKLAVGSLMAKQGWANLRRRARGGGEGLSGGGVTTLPKITVSSP